MKPFSINIRGRLVEYRRPAVMGIVNVTPDSFYGGSRAGDAADAGRRAAAMVAQGADMLDVGAYSSRPGADDVPEAEECARLRDALAAVREAVGSDVPVSVDTFRASVAAKAVGLWGADIVNDISGGKLDGDMFATVAELRAPYILMHMRGTPATMQTLTDYADVTTDVIRELTAPLAELEKLGVADVIVDPGFGFAKTLEQNYSMLRHLDRFALLGRPLLVGVSRKSMITKLLSISADEALEGTTAVNTLALERGAAIVRVHDVAAAVAARAVVSAITEENEFGH